MPIWIAYIAAPLLLLLLTSGIILKSDNPAVLAAFAVGSGLLCAGCLHGYVALKRWIAGRREKP